MSTATIDAKASGTFDLGGDLTVDRLGFGAMRITGQGIWGEPKNPEESIKVLRRLPNIGVNFIDTADSYGPEVSERLIAEALYPYPKDLVIATKGGLTRQGPNQWLPVGRPEYLRQCVEMSLRRLRLDRIDLYQLHRIDAKVPVEESLGALADLQKAGKIRHIGLSEVTQKEQIQSG
jgi:pyridoxine 4-dehydrogenase